MPKTVTVWRDDGKCYPSLMAAARALADEWGAQMDKRNLESISREIGRAARHVRGRKAAFGHMWHEHDEFTERAKAEKLVKQAARMRARIAALEDALGATRARLESANDLLRANGLEMQ